MVPGPWGTGAGKVKKGLNQAEIVVDTQVYPRIAMLSRPCNWV